MSTDGDEDEDRNLFVCSEDVGVDVARSHRLEPRSDVSISAAMTWSFDVLVWNSRF